MRLAKRALYIAMLPALATTALAQAEAPSLQRFVVIVANNHSQDKNLQPLEFADDDGARYHELFAAAKASISLFTVLDRDAQNRYPHIATQTQPPSKKLVLSRIKDVFAEIEEANSQGIETHFYFIFSGHGNVGPNREGYVHLLDDRLTRSELYQQIIAPSPASYNHLILDACHSYYLVNKKGAGEKKGNYRKAVLDFLRSEELSSYPNTGVIMGASRDSETHEWSRYEGGVLSHQLRGALLGAADVDNDGVVRYDEAAACIEAANAAVENPRARLRVYYRAPAQNSNISLLELGALKETPVLHLETSLAGRYYIEDDRGVRIADFHPTNEQPVQLALVGRSPFFLRSKNQEATIASGDLATISASSLTFTARRSSDKGFVEQSFRRNLYQVPFGLGFYQGVNTRPKEEVLVDTASSPVPLLGALGFAAAGAALIAAAVGISAGYLSYLSYAEYSGATTREQADRFQLQTEQQALVANISFAAAIVAALAGGILIPLEFLDLTAETQQDLQQH